MYPEISNLRKSSCQKMNTVNSFAALIIWFCISYSADRAVLQDKNCDSAFDNSRGTCPILKIVQPYFYSRAVNPCDLWRFQETFDLLIVLLTADIANLQM